jgi:type IV pilus assembly protein PilB
MKKLGEILIESKLIDAYQLETALSYQQKCGCKLGQAIADLNFAKELDVALAVAQHINVPYINIFSENFSDEELKNVDESLVRKYDIIPVRRVGNTLEVAMPYPSNLNLIDDIQLALGRNIKPLLALESEIKAFIRQYYTGTLVHRKYTTRTSPDKLEVVSQQSIGENESKYQALRKIKMLAVLLAEKGVLTSEETAKIID